MEEGWPVPVPCECLTSSGGSENAGLYPSVFYLFIYLFIIDLILVGSALAWKIP